MANATHRLARIDWTLLKHGQDYVQKTMPQEEAEHRHKQRKNLEKKARLRGLELVPKPA